MAEAYVGVLPRARRGGSVADLLPTHRIAWVDIDRQDAQATLASFGAPPTMAVRSGTPGYLHAYWLLKDPQPVAAIERMNCQLAVALGGDTHTTDGPRVMRPPGAWNHKTTPARPAALATYRPDRVYSSAELLAAVPPAPSAREHSFASGRASSRVADGDRLLSLNPAYYVEQLTDRIVPRSRKVLCPLHVETSPSFHVYPDPAGGWFCFGCRRGGSVYDLAAALWNRPPHGPAFRVLRVELERLLL